MQFPKLRVSKTQDCDYRINITDSQGRLVAQIVTDDAIEETAEEKALAKLLASAPEMLEKLQHYEQVMKRF
jgi:hypothetical protein